MSDGKIKGDLIAVSGAVENDFPLFDAHTGLKGGGVSTQAGNDLTGFKVWKGDSAAYAALSGEHDSNTVYFVM